MSIGDYFLNHYERVFNQEQDILNRTRVRILAVCLLTFIGLCSTLQVLFLFQEHNFLFTRMGVFLVLFLAGLALLLFREPWSVAGHFFIICLTLMIWSGVLLFRQSVNAATAELVILVVSTGYYILGRKWGTFYSLVNMAPILGYVILDDYLGLSLPTQNLNINHHGYMLGLISNFLLLLYIHYFFFKAFKKSQLKEFELRNHLQKVNRLYSFISGINRTIVHVKHEQALFKDVCNIAVRIGQFRVAWIGLFQIGQKINLVASTGLPPEDMALFTNARYDDYGPQSHVLNTGLPFISNDSSQDLEQDTWKQYASVRGYGSFIVFPIKKSGVVIGTLNLYASQRDTFDAAEIRLLEEAAADISFALDVFEKEALRLQTENKLKHSELRLKQAQEIAHIGNWELDFATGIAIWSEETLRIYGLPPEDAVQSLTSWMSHIHPEDLDDVTRLTQEAQSTLSNSAFYHRIIRSDGAIRHIYSLAHFEFDKDGKPIGLYGIAHDVTEMKEAQESLAQSEANLHLILDLVPQAIFLKDFDGKFLFVNKSLSALYGLRPEELIHKSQLGEITLLEQGLRFLEQDREVILSGKKKIFSEQEFTGPDGEQKIFYTIKVPFTQIKGTKAVLGIANNITEQKKYEAEREKMMADIIQRNENLEQFSYIISHNLRGPVTSIIGLAGLLNDDSLDKEEIAVFPKQLMASVMQIDEVIKDLNKVLQVKGVISETKETVDLLTLVENIQISLNYLNQKRNVKIITDFSEAKEFVTLRSYLYSIFYNLITNSIKYHQPGLPPLIEIKSKKCDGKFVIKFQDNGMGIDLSKKADQVFGLYKRFHFHVEGKGIGLFMVKTQVETLGGKISVASEINVGTVFTIVFEL
ncbi:MAG TPA: PAS domain S-box protein [Mucilaginibacter sp.]